MAAQKRSHSDGSTKIKCDTCGAEGHGPENKTHRKCTKNADKSAKGTWRKAQNMTFLIELGNVFIENKSDKSL